MDYRKGIQIAKNLLAKLNTELTPEKKIRQIFKDSELITEEHASEFDREKIFKWREKHIESDLPNLRENESAGGELLGIRNRLTIEIESILNSLINSNQEELNKE